MHALHSRRVQHTMGGASATLGTLERVDLPHPLPCGGICKRIPGDSCQCDPKGIAGTPVNERPPAGMPCALTIQLWIDGHMMFFCFLHTLRLFCPVLLLHPFLTRSMRLHMDLMIIDPQRIDCSFIALRAVDTLSRDFHCSCLPYCIPDRNYLAAGQKLMNDGFLSMQYLTRWPIQPG